MRPRWRSLIARILCRSETHRCCSEWVWRATTACCNPIQVIISLLYQVARKLLAVPVLRRQLTGPVRYEPADRLWSRRCPRSYPDAGGRRYSR